VVAEILHVSDPEFDIVETRLRRLGASKVEEILGKIDSDDLTGWTAASAAGIADAPDPQPTSKTVEPGRSASRAIVRCPYLLQNASGSSSKWSAAAL
jgi:hypothetical protein